MARRMLTRKVTFTTVKVAKLVRENGVTEAIDLPDEVLIGNRSVEQAQKQMNKKYEDQVQVMEVQADTKEYEMPIEEFIKQATVKEDKQDEEEQSN